MRILLTGANGYIGQRLLPMLLEAGHEVIALVRSKGRFSSPTGYEENITVWQGNLHQLDQIEPLPENIDAAYYLVHSLAEKTEELEELERLAARNFLRLLETTNCKQIIYLSGLVGDKELSEHLQSRKSVENTLQEGAIPLTTLRAGIIIGSGSASFEIMRDLVEKLPIMIAPLWVEKRCQPIGIFDVLEYLTEVLGNQECYGRSFDIGGPDILTYREMLLTLAKVRELKRWIIGVPVLTPRLSSYWLHFVTSTNVRLASALIESLKNDAICKEHSIQKIIPKTCFSFETALKRTLAKIEDNAVLSSWKDSISTTTLSPDLFEYAEAPSYGVLSDEQKVPFSCTPEAVKAAIWAIGGERGWYYMNWAWTVRGWIDQLALGFGLRRGRTHPTRIRTGDALDFWRVLLADQEHGRLLLYAEMKLPGEAWLEFRIEEGALIQTASFRPSGLLGRLYWYSVYPFHWFIFAGMAQSIVRYAEENA